MKKEYLLPLSKFKVGLAYYVMILVGLILLFSQNFVLILCGFALITIGFHELGHLIALMEKNYNIVGLAFLVPLGIGSKPDRPIQLQDSTAVYFAGLISVVVPFIMMYFTFVFGVFFLIGTISLSIIDILHWWQLRKEFKT